MRLHPQHTQMVLQRVPGFGELAEVAASHHERLDGRDYHRGLTGAELSRPARILAVADVCEALSADRPYRPALTTEHVRDIMSRDVGIGLCPEAYAALESYLEAPSQVPVPYRAPSARPPAGRSAGRGPAAHAAPQPSGVESAGCRSSSAA